MPPPASYLDITAVPFSQVIAQADFNGGTYGGVANEVWFRFVTASQIAFGGYADKGGTFVPVFVVYDSDGTTVLHTINPSAGSPRSWYYVFSAGTYYVKISRSGGGASNFDFTAQFDTRPILSAVAAGGIIVNDDTVGFPAIVLEPTTGEVLGVLTQIPAGETAAIFPTGETIWHQTQSPFGISVFDSDLNLVISGIDDHSVNEAALCRSDDDFYFFYENAIDKITKAGVVTTTPLSTGIAQANIKAVQMSADGSILYYITGGNIASGQCDGKIKRWNVLTDTAMADFYTIPGFTNADGDQLAMTGNNNDNGNLLRLSDGTFVTHSYDGSADLFSLLHISDAGVLLHQYDYAGYGATTYGIIDHISHDLNDPDSVIVWFFKDSSGEEARFARVNLSDGTLTVIADTDMFSQGINFHTNSSIIFAPSNSCVHVLYNVTPTGTIIVNKTAVDDPTREFPFTTTGLTPTDFTLKDGESQEFTGVTPGSGYGIQETVPPGWVARVTVSNCSPPDNISVDADEVVTVDVENILLPVEEPLVPGIPAPAPGSICVEVFRRLGDPDARIWSNEEIDRYIEQAMREMCTETRLIWDWVYVENLPRGMSHNHLWEIDFINEIDPTFSFSPGWKYGPGDGMGDGQANYTYDDERRAYQEIARDALTKEEEDIREGPARHTFPDEITFLALLGSDQQAGTANLPHRLTEMERATWDYRTIEANHHHFVHADDNRYEIQYGEVFQYTWKKDGVRSFRKIRIPSALAETYEIDGLWGIPRDITDVVEDTIEIAPEQTEEWGTPRIIPTMHPIGPFFTYRMWGIPRRFYKDRKNVRVEHWRTAFISCLDSELPPRYRHYLQYYVMWRALTRQGPGQDFKLARWYRARWENALERIKSRIKRQSQERIGRMGGIDGAPPTGGPPRPRLPWQYGKRVR